MRENFSLRLLHLSRERALDTEVIVVGGIVKTAGCVGFVFWAAMVGCRERMYIAGGWRVVRGEALRRDGG